MVLRLFYHHVGLQNVRHNRQETDKSPSRRSRNGQTTTINGVTECSSRFSCFLNPLTELAANIARSSVRFESHQYRYKTKSHDIPWRREAKLPNYSNVVRQSQYHRNIIVPCGMAISNSARTFPLDGSIAGAVCWMFPMW